MIREHVTHYRKYKLNSDISIRYFYTFEDKRSLENKWIIKSHSKKEYLKLDPTQALKMLSLYGINEADYTEIRGKLLPDGDYEKLIIKPNGKIKLFRERDEYANGTNE